MFLSTMCIRMQLHFRLKFAFSYMCLMANNFHSFFLKGQVFAPRSVAIVGHSMGGLVARALLTLKHFKAELLNVLITQATPHAAPVMPLDQYLTGMILASVSALDVYGCASVYFIFFSGVSGYVLMSAETPRIQCCSVNIHALAWFHNILWKRFPLIAKPLSRMCLCVP